MIDFWLITNIVIGIFISKIIIEGLTEYGKYLKKNRRNK